MLAGSNHGDWVRAVRFRIQAPRIIRLLRFDQTPRQTVRLNRRTLFARDGNRCQYCGKAYPHSQLSFDHVTPRSRGGDDLLGERGHLLLDVQLAERRPHAPGSRHAAARCGRPSPNTTPC